MTFVTLELPRISGLETEGINPNREQTLLRKESLVADVRDRVIEALLRRDYDKWIKLETATTPDQNTVPFIVRLGLNQNIPIIGTGVAPLIRFLKEGVLNFKYFNESEDNVFPVRQNPLQLPTDPRFPSLIVIEGFVSKVKVANTMVLGPSPFIRRLESGNNFLIDEVSRIGICRPANSAHGKRLINEIRTALED